MAIANDKHESEHRGYASARQLQEETLKSSRELLGETHPDTLTAMAKLAWTLCKLGDLAGARKLQEQVLEENRRVRGEEHSQTLTAMSNLAVTLYS